MVSQTKKGSMSTPDSSFELTRKKSFYDDNDGPDPSLGFRRQRSGTNDFRVLNRNDITQEKTSRKVSNDLPFGTRKTQVYHPTVSSSNYIDRNHGSGSSLGFWGQQLSSANSSGMENKNGIAQQQKSKDGSNFLPFEMSTMLQERASAIGDYVTPIGRPNNKKVRIDMIPQRTSAMETTLAAERILENESLLAEESTLVNENTLSGESNQTPEGIPIVEGKETVVQQQETVQYKKFPGSPYVVIDQERVTTAVGRAPVLSGYKNTWDPRSEKDIAFFWKIPEAGGSSIKNIISSCHKLTMASDAGITEGHDQENDLEIVRVTRPTETGMALNSFFVNVDTTTILGLERAQRLGLVRSELAQVIETPFIFEPESLFDAARRGRIFTIFRHPVDRAARVYAYLKNADWEPTYSPMLASMSIEQYAESSYAEDNWMTRYLSNDPDAEATLTNAHLEVAMDIVRRKFLVGLSDKIEESLERFEKFFRWKYSVDPSNQEKCREVLLEKGANSSHKVEIPQPGSQAYDLLAAKNVYDIKLYEYVESLFKEQEQFVENIPDGFRLEGIIA
eukprot:CAMPEP_0195524684 /NCGR_PEP_ID=MMETSP0794_2-20130614/24658_1 /TAXON_ID=515487 /ORGANISM="Stephanopyxis turris, Strain CCMP 815" /LENGTH=562 /DNA_ID=CAMNT_0040654957 /DNA_START=357 /DNA_END=2045 /DNA_ORIENTATION=-